MFISTANLYADRITLALKGLGYQAEKVVVDVWQDEVICTIGLRFTYKDLRPQRPIDNFNDVVTFDVQFDVEVSGSPAADAMKYKNEADYLFAKWEVVHA
jgi:hypothetical protein